VSREPLALVIEDHRDIRELVAYHLRRESVRVTAAATGEEGLAAAGRETPDLVILDLMLPGMDGLSVCRKLRAADATRETPILVLTAKGEEADVVTGLETGADDYITKPFSPRVLMARVRAALRRIGLAEEEGPGPADEELDLGRGLLLRPGRHEVLLDGERIDLTATEFKLLHCLARRMGLVFTRNQLLDVVHGKLHAVTDRAVDVQVVGLRRKLGAHGDRVETVRGVGYRLTEG